MPVRGVVAAKIGEAGNAGLIPCAVVNIGRFGSAAVPVPINGAQLPVHIRRPPEIPLHVPESTDPAGLG